MTRLLQTASSEGAWNRGRVKHDFDADLTRNEEVSFLAELMGQVRSVGTFDGPRMATFLGAAFSSIPVADDASLVGDDCFDGIPTMLAPRELRLLMNLFRTIPIDGAILEVGCYLGGSTGAIAHGLQANGFRGQFYVLDSFRWSEPRFVARLQGDLKTLSKTYALSNDAWADAGVGDWLQTFKEIDAAPHRHLRSTVEVRKALLPLQPGETFDLGLHIPPGVQLGAVFIDGFKSWFATLTGMGALQPYLRNGTLLIFQDFSWHSCYWLPILATLMGERWCLLMKIENTAVFELLDPDLSAGLAAFGTGPDPKYYEFYRTILDNYAITMFHSGDELGFLQHTCQAYILAHTLGYSRDAAEKKAFIKSVTGHVKCGWVFRDISGDSFDFPLA